VAASRATCADAMSFEGDVTGSRVERITRGKTVDAVRAEDRRLKQLHTLTAERLKGESFLDLVDWAFQRIQ